MNRRSWRGPRAPAGRRGAARLQREPSPAPRSPGPAVLSDLGVCLRPAGTRNCAVTPAGRGSGSGPARARAGVPPRPRACIGSPEGQGPLLPLPALERPADAPTSMELPWILASGRGNPQHRSPGRTSPKETAPEPERKMHSGALGGGCLSPRKRAVAGDRLSPFISSISGARGVVKKYPLQVTGGRGGGCGRRSCSISKFQAGQYSSHPPPTFPSSLRISSWAKEMGAGDWAAQRAEHPAGGEACDSTS